MTRVRWRCCRGDGGDVVWPASRGVLGCRKRSRTVAVALAGVRTSGDRRKAASPATGDPPLSLRLLEPPCLPFRWPPPVPDGSGSRPWASRPLPSEPCSVSSPLAHCLGVGVCLGQAPPLLLSPSRHRGGRPSLIHPSLQLCVRKHSGPSRSWPCRQGSGAPVPCPPPSLHSRSGQGARRSRLGAEGVQRGQEATEGRWLR